MCVYMQTLGIPLCRFSASLCVTRKALESETPRCRHEIGARTPPSLKRFTLILINWAIFASSIDNWACAHTHLASVTIIFCRESIRPYYYLFKTFSHGKINSSPPSMCVYVPVHYSIICSTIIKVLIRITAQLLSLSLLPPSLALFSTRLKCFKWLKSLSLYFKFVIIAAMWGEKKLSHWLPSQYS